MNTKVSSDEMKKSDEGFQREVTQTPEETMGAMTIPAPAQPVQPPQQSPPAHQSQPQLGPGDVIRQTGGCFDERGNATRLGNSPEEVEKSLEEVSKGEARAKSKVKWEGEAKLRGGDKLGTLARRRVQHTRAKRAIF